MNSLKDHHRLEQTITASQAADRISYILTENPLRMTRGVLVGGEFSSLVLRQKERQHLEMGELLIAQVDNDKYVLQIVDLSYGSQMNQSHLELVGGLRLEGKSPFFDGELRMYTLARLKLLAKMHATGISKAKQLPPILGEVRTPIATDFSFIRPDNALHFGSLRSGSAILEVPILLDATKVVSHHMLIAATTGRGKSNLLKHILWELAGQGACGMIVLDPHDEYWRGALDLHPQKARIHHYSATLRPGSTSLRINISLLRPQHFHGVVDWTDAQRQAIIQYYREYGQEWIESIILEKPLDGKFHEGTLAVVRRRVMQTLGLELSETIIADSIFVTNGGLTTIDDIILAAERSEMAVIDTSSLDGPAELLVSSMIATEIFSRFRKYNLHGELATKPVVGLVLEEAPRVLGKEVLERGPNIFSTIAREGRKFHIGLLAITQLPSLIPREILANMNTKVIMGMEMRAERQALIESASQDLSDDDRTIASLDKGEAIVTSVFVPFALPIQIPLFAKTSTHSRRQFLGIQQA